MSMLIDLVPQEVTIGGKVYDINTDFRYSILFELLMQDDSMLDDEKIQNALQLYYPVIPEDLSGAVRNMLWFYKCGKKDDVVSEEVVEDEGNSEQPNKSNQIYSFEHDDEYIYSAFLDQYDIDLQDIEHLHWWKFRALFKSLKEDNLISKILGYRSIKISDDMTDRDKKYYRKMKQIYALPDNRTQEEKENDFNSSMSNMF